MNRDFRRYCVGKAQLVGRRDSIRKKSSFFAPRDSIELREIADEPFVTVSDTAPALRAVIDDYVRQSGIAITPTHEADNLAMAISLVASRRGFALFWRVGERCCGTLAPTAVGGRPDGGRRSGVVQFPLAAPRYACAGSGVPGSSGSSAASCTHWRLLQGVIPVRLDSG